VLREYQAVNRLKGPLFAWSFRIFNTPTGMPDITFVVAADETQLHAHRAILCARSRYFRRMFAQRWRGRSEVRLVDPRMSGGALTAVLAYLYTERLVCGADELADVLALARNLKLRSLIRFLQRVQPAAMAAEAAAAAADDEFTTSHVGGGGRRHAAVAADLGVRYRPGSKPRPSVPVEVREPAEDAAGSPAELGLRYDIWRHLLRAGVPDAAFALPDEDGAPNAALAQWWPVPSPNDDGDGGDSERPLPHDVEFEVQGLLFKAHRAFVCLRSSYFRSMLEFEVMARPPAQQQQRDATA
jgi:hypothetical protein